MCACVRVCTILQYWLFGFHAIYWLVTDVQDANVRNDDEKLHIKMQAFYQRAFQVTHTLREQEKEPAANVL